MLGGIFLYAAYHYQFNTPEIQANQIQRIRDVITPPLSIEKSSKGYQAIQLHLKSYPEFSFDLNGIALAETNARDFESNVKVGDTLTLEVLKEEYQKKLSREIPLGFWDKTLNYSLVSVYGLRDQNSTYLHLADYNRAKQKDSPIGVWLFGLIGLWVLGTGIYMYSGKSGR